MKESAGTLLYRQTAAGIEVLLVHSSGSYNRKKPWSIPKGLADAGESLEDAARRETWEETGVVVVGPLVDIGMIEYRSGKKRVYGFAGPAPENAAPCCASWEVDRAEFVPLDRAAALLHPDQAAFVERLKKRLAKPQD